MVTKVSDQSIKIDNIKRALQSGATDKAILLSQQALNTQHTPANKIELLYLLAVAQRSKGIFNEAINTIKTLIASDPNHARAHQEKGYLLLSSGEKPKAVSAFNRATRLNPALLAQTWPVKVWYRYSMPANLLAVIANKPALGVTE